MANEKLKQNYKNIANSIRAKTGKNGTIKADEMAAEIDSIETGIEPTGTIDITTNGTHNVAQYGEANVNVPNPSTGTKNITTNGDHDVTAFATAHVAVPEPSGTYYVYENGRGIDISRYQYVDVEVPFSLPQYAIDLSDSEYIYDEVNTISAEKCDVTIYDDSISIYLESPDLSELDENCYNLENILSNYWSSSTAPILLLTDKQDLSIKIECGLDVESWPYWGTESQTLIDKMQSLSSHFYINDVAGIYLDTVWLHQRGGS